MVRHGLQNYIWIELIGFDNEKQDFGVADYLKTIGFIPKGLSLLLTSVDFVNMHTSMEQEYLLEDDYCSYSGHPYNAERARQKWSNYQLRDLIVILQSYHIAVYCSFFDYVGKYTSLQDAHPELKVLSYNKGILHERKLFSMIKRFSDGSYYEDFFLAKILQVLRDFGFDGIHLADGIVRPRIPIQTGDFSDDIIEQSGIVIPEGENTCEYILHHKRLEWIRFYKTRWAAYLKKIIDGVHSAGFKVITNSAWPKDPTEAIYRYGVDYKTLEACGIDGFVLENGAPTLSILDDESNENYHYTYEYRKMVHHYFVSNMVLNRAYMSKIPFVPLYPLQDTLEQYDVLRHAPTALERHSAMMATFFIVDEMGVYRPVVNGHTFCLGDGLTSEEWQRVRNYIESAVVDSVYHVPGATFVWSDKRNDAEVEALAVHRTWTSGKWLSELLFRGACIHKVARIENLNKVTGDLVVTNPQLMPEDELEVLQSYTKGKEYYLSHPQDDADYSALSNPDGYGFPCPLDFAKIDEACLDETTAAINEGLSYISAHAQECNVTEICTSKTTSRFYVENEEYYYNRPKIHTGRKIKHASAQNRLRGFPIRIDEDAFTVLVPLRGVTIIDVEFE